ncbi:amidohydrolase [Virgibacillus sp. W0181]|uniref:amidohydrolase n=1 Tax=Virgibacillus sp. W0181 TaxID=3391581 RepID=UPI003F47467D
MEPDTIYFNGEVHTLDSEDNVYEAVAVIDKKITAVGSNDEILKLQSKETHLVDLNCQTVLPGFTDAHIHLFSLGFNLSYVDCQLDSIEEVVEAIKKRAQTAKSEDEWIIGWGFDESKYKERRKPNKLDFKDVKNPVYITRYCLHEAVINEAGIQKANITVQTAIDGGFIDRTDNGEATGLLVEKAKNLIEDVLPPYTYESMKKAISLVNQYLLENGITTVHDAGLGFLIDSEKEFEVLKEMSEAGNLQVKIYAMVLAEYYSDFLKKYQNQQSEQLKIGSYKLFADGTLSGGTAALNAPYKDTEEKGMLLYTDEELKNKMKVAYDLNKQVAIHAIGDRAIDQAVRTFEALQQEYPNRDDRPRIEHTTVSNDDIRDRMKKINATPIPQPLLIYMAGDMYNLEKERLDNVFAVKSCMNQGLKPAGSSDGPVVDSSPFLGMHALMTRETISGKPVGKDQIIDVKTAVKMYTNHAAYAAFEEDEKGSIEAGKYADLVILPEGFMNFSAEEVKQTKVKMTIVNGEIVYEKKPCVL